MRTYYVYILASKRYGTLYIGVTNDLMRRVQEHKTDKNEGFTKRYGIHQLMYYEESDDICVAITREKALKGTNRQKKIDLIEMRNPHWIDLSIGWY